MPLRLREATVDDIPAMARVGVDAFENDELNLVLFPPAPDLTPDRHYADRLRFRAWITLDRMVKPGRITMVAVDDEKDGQIAGYAQWTKPAPPEGREPDPPAVSPEAAASVTFEREEFPPAFDKEKLPVYRAVSGAEERRVLGEDGTKNVWCLDILAVDPACQGRGVGRMLVQWGIEKAKAEGKGLYLCATPTGKPFYSRLGLGLENVGAFELWGIHGTSFVLRS
ncbi:acyl-CoA N-acyltransferase [Coniochaeta ligniaria NRRL 30616]|uniref:Acyl-CoA N-acyltransferase n=1 Tax=Coniochaeta ligniaria NRRL 30616 TaxID=1408157 RepID=A0A1J7JAY5_9PEZI|nr:acyl-CoA N-acyltransferase [Coniochaeta ligniaria NRRL 30616]